MEELPEISLTGLAYGGDAIGRLPDGQVIFVPFGIPGERVRVRPQASSKNKPARGEIVQILEASPERIEPKCKHFGVCGGCHYQHMPYGAQLLAKQNILREQLQRLGKIEAPTVREAVGSPSPWNYRNHVQFHLTAEGRLGYVQHHGRNVFAISECHLPEPAINELWPQLVFEPGSGIQRVSLRAGDELMMTLESAAPEPVEMELEAGISVVHLFEDDPLVLAGQAGLTVPLRGRTFRVSAASFFQVNTLMAERMVETMLRVIPATADTILDLYCGVGLFSAFLAARCRRQVGVESSASACMDFEANLAEFDNVELYEGTVEQVLPVLELTPQVVLVDPPRAGMDRRVLQDLVKRRPPVLVYVSCDPSTLARDAAQLIAGGFHLVEVTPFDLFPQTYHIESLSVFSAKTLEQRDS